MKLPVSSWPGSINPLSLPLPISTSFGTLICPFDIHLNALNCLTTRPAYTERKRC